MPFKLSNIPLPMIGLMVIKLLITVNIQGTRLME